MRVPALTATEGALVVLVPGHIAARMLGLSWSALEDLEAKGLLPRRQQGELVDLMRWVPAYLKLVTKTTAILQSLETAIDLEPGRIVEFDPSELEVLPLATDPLEEDDAERVRRQVADDYVEAVRSSPEDE